jgi:hypothetical protein
MMKQKEKLLECLSEIVHTSVDKDVEKLELHIWLMGMQNGVTTLENSLVVS